MTTSAETLDERDLRVDFYDNASPGDNYRVACRISHIPTGKVGMSEQHLSRLNAKREATDRLKAKLIDAARRDELRKLFDAGELTCEKAGDLCRGNCTQNVVTGQIIDPDCFR
jgi:protein subunit release factor A